MLLSTLWLSLNDSEWSVETRNPMICYTIPHEISLFIPRL